ncbi:hypothetical protein [Spongiivirga citrea]|uniref:DUF4251 domain-containing protein n=1 Tax=Spongiivirga citrea TaxID=1481457 RepID=A0A6M0CL76_9FLAO|nr:hypothetical protein [Spongiivirga citrea]NER18686.1 hypothetical protein [Spongiivirga citrea]
MKSMFKSGLLLITALGCFQFTVAQENTFSTSYVLESDLYANQLKKELDNNVGSKAAYDDAAEIGKLLRHNASQLDSKIPIPMPPCNYTVVCGSNKLEGVVTKDLGYIDASIVDSNDNVVATLNVSPIFVDASSGIKVYNFVWTHQVFGKVTLNITRPTTSKETKQYKHQVVLQ